MSLEVYSQSGSKQESSQCTPDGNCFIVVYNLDSFLLRMKGPKGSVFEPAEYKIDAKKGENCDEIAFKLKGFSLKFAVKSKNQEDQVLNGPEGLTVELRRASKKGSAPIAKEITDSNGQVVFKDITTPDVYEVRVNSNDDLTFKQPEVNCDFKWESGFKCEHEFFLITGFSISG